MLVLSRKSMERVEIGDGIVITVVEIRGNKVRIGIDAPKDIRVLRTELHDQASDASGNHSRAPAASYDPRDVEAWETEGGAVTGASGAARFELNVTRGKNMAKYRHRTFEMYDFRDEAIHALTPKTAHPVIEPFVPEESWPFKYLAVSRSASVTHVEFKRAQAFDEDTVSDLREDFAQLADRLARDSKVLLNFVGVKSFGAAPIDELVLLKQKLRTKGSRLALCCLDPAARESFFFHHKTV